MKFKLFVTVLVVLAAAVTIADFVTGAEKAAPAQPSASPASPDASRGGPRGEEAKCLKIGVVSVRRIFQDCKRMAKYRQEFTAEGDKMEAELDKLTQEIKADKSGLKTLKSGSLDYLSTVKEILEKQGNLQAKQEYFKQLMDMRQQTIFEQLFKDVVKATAEVAKEKGLDLVLEKSEPEQPGEIGTQKVLYSAGCEDITDAVLAKVDAADKSAEK
jgi:Skp family chaperone for outer membrane proteins